MNEIAWENKKRCVSDNLITRRLEFPKKVILAPLNISPFNVSMHTPSHVEEIIGNDSTNFGNIEHPVANASPHPLDLSTLNISPSGDQGTQDTILETSSVISSTTSLDLDGSNNEDPLTEKDSPYNI